MLSTVQYVGLIGGSIVTLGGIPQIIKMLKTKETKDLSYSMLIMWIIGLILSDIYAFNIHQLPIMITNTLSLSLSVFMLTLKIYFEHFNNKIIFYKQLDSI